ncbi:hypothetical protein [Capnocytophaga canis]|uniref:hypothetical protein n=1 Tax=Capnocytophaga canis TaxID=1848903 RepID=UPI001561AFA4|nr:hypothetical protein [Capnocytophaga canis]
MDRNAMIQALRKKFSPSTLEQAVYLEKPNTYNIENLTATEVERLYNRFFPKPTSAEVVASRLIDEMELKRLRSIVLTDAQFVGLYTPDNWTRFNNFMKYRSVLKKLLNAYTLDEFPLLIKQFKSIRSKFVSSKMRVGDTQWYNYFGFMTISK